LKLYAYPSLGRAGFGNELFPYTRALVWAEASGALLIAPTWPSLRLGPYLRRERDKRHYQSILRPMGLSGAKKLATLSLLPRHVEDELQVAPLEHGVVVFRGMRSLFCDLPEDVSLVRGALLAQRQQKHDYRAGLPARSYVGVHVRFGDFAQAPLGSSLDGATNVRLPLEWYVEALELLREGVRQEVPALVSSDATDSELGMLLRLPGVRRTPSRNDALSDILALSDASALITSNSSCSGGGSYLGAVPSLWYPGQKKYWSGPASKNETWCDGGELEESWLGRVRAKLALRS